MIKRCDVLKFLLCRMRIIGLFLTSPKHFISYQTFSTRHFQTLVSSTWLRNQLAASRELSSQLRVLDASWQSNGQGYEQLYKQWEYSSSIFLLVALNYVYYRHKNFIIQLFILVVTLSLFALIIYRCIDQFLKSPLSFLFSFTIFWLGTQY